MDKSLIIIFYIVTFIIILSLFNKKDVLEDNLTLKVENQVDSITKDDIIHYKKLEDHRHAVLLDQMKRLSITNSNILNNQSKQVTVTPSSSTSQSEAIVNEAGQSFRRLVTEQPHRFNKGTDAKTSTQIRLNWDFNRIVPKYAGATDVVSNLNYLGLDENGIRSNTLPYIKCVKVQLLNGSNWENIPAVLLTPSAAELTYSDTNGILVKGNIDKPEARSVNIKRAGVSSINRSSLPTEGFNLTRSGFDLLDSTNPIKLRVFGINNAPDNAPPFINNSNVTSDDSRVMIFDTNFTNGNPASPVIITSATLQSGSNILLDLRVVHVEEDASDSIAGIRELTTVYEEHLSFGNSVGLLAPITHVTSYLGSGEDNNFSTTITDTRPGMSYIMNFSTKNTLDSTSPFTTNTTPITDSSDTILVTNPPDRNSVPNSINVNIDSSDLKTITSPNFIAQDLKYFSTNTGSINYVTSSTQTFEVSNPDNLPNKIVASSNFLGIGRGIKDVNNLVSITQTLDGTELTRVQYNGFTDTPTQQSGSGGTISGISHEDSYETGDVNSRGFRIKGTCSLGNFFIDSLSSSPNIRNFTTVFNRNSTFSVRSETNTSSRINFVIDSLSGNPSISGTDLEMTINLVVRTMSIPSVKSINLSPLTRTYTNINTSNGFMKNDMKISSFKYIEGEHLSRFSVVSSETNFNFNLSDRTQINNTGEYTITSFNLVNKIVSNAISGPNFESTINYEDTAFNLNGSISVQNSLNFKIHCDRRSYDDNFTVNFPDDVFFPKTSNGTTLFTQMQTDPTNKIEQYTNHEAVPNAFSMLYYRNTFNVDTANYPDNSSFSDFFSGLSMGYNKSNNGMSLTLPTSEDQARSGIGVASTCKMVVFRIDDLLSECTILKDSTRKSVSLNQFLINKRVNSVIINDCKTPYGNSMAFVFAKKGAEWAIGSPAINYSTFGFRWWSRQNIESTGDSGLSKFFKSPDKNGTKDSDFPGHLGVTYEDSSEGIDLSSPIFVLILSKIL